jgi:hypothetical protein
LRAETELHPCGALDGLPSGEPGTGVAVGRVRNRRAEARKPAVRPQRPDSRLRKSGSRAPFGCNDPPLAREPGPPSRRGTNEANFPLITCVRSSAAERTDQAKVL